MAESNATQVILTDDGLKIIKAQNTANNADSGITDLNDPNLMSVIEKQNNIAQFAGLTSQYNVIVQNAKDEGIDTVAVTTAYNNLNRFMTNILADHNHASSVDRATYKKYQDAYNGELAKLQNALKNNIDNKFTSAANATRQAASTANAAKSAADSSYKYANSEIAVQSTATAKAQSKADDAFSKAQEVGNYTDNQITSQASAVSAVSKTASEASSRANSAIEKADGANAEITRLKGGSTTTIAKLEDGLGVKVSNDTFATYKTQTASQFAETVKEADFTTYKTQTSRLIEAKVDNGTYQSDKTQTANDISSKVSSGDFNTYKTQTDKLINDKVSSSEYASDKKQTASEIADRVSNSAFSTYQTQTASQIASKVDNGDFSTYKTQTANLIAEKVATKDFSAYQATTAKSIDSKVESSDFNTYKTQTADAISSKVATKDFSTYKTQTADDINLKVTKKDLIDQINLQAGNTLISSSGQLTLSGKTIYFDTVNPVIITSANIDTLLVGKKLKAADIMANTFKTNNETFTVESNGAITAKNMTLIGGTLSSQTINASTINGSTINGTTFNAGDSISNSNNTSNFYPFTIEPTGKASTTLFNSVDALRTEMSGGGLRTMYRAINSSGNQYEAYDGNFSGDMISLNSGFTNGKDMSFSQSVSGSQLTGQVLISPLNGLTLHGDTQQITFNGTSADVTPKGIIITPYGNINPNGTQNIWYVGNGPTMKTASFGIDGSGANNIKFNRSLDIGNFNIGTYHTITSSDGGPIHFNRDNGKSGDIYASAVHYESLVKVSLLSVKKDVRKADTAYWAQLVNSIDLATYQYKTDDNTSHLRLSSIVDDVNVTKQWQLPDVFISRDEDGKLCGVDDSVLLNATLATVQEQQKEIDQLNGHNMELEARLNKLEAKLNG
ncbi:phage tail protein [Lactiplantibacillus plantarum]|uniref:phage tail protein n=1 Tax=Lactiplantibacillus plantarum TaxID=1590 RepID=UPI000B413AA7|nr:phage tail protein [Lactiplantibacillus plantarum]